MTKEAQECKVSDPWRVEVFTLTPDIVPSHIKFNGTPLLPVQTVLPHGVDYHMDNLVQELYRVPELCAKAVELRELLDEERKNNPGKFTDKVRF